MQNSLPLKTFLLQIIELMYNVAINACAKLRDGNKALVFLQELQEKGIKPSTLTYNQTIDALVRSGQTSIAFEIFEQMRIKRLPVHGATFATLIKGCSSVEYSNRAIQLFQLCKAEYPLELDDIVYFSTIDVLHKHGRFHEIDSIYLHAYQAGVLSHWFPSRDYRFDFHEFTTSAAAAGLRCGFSEILADFERHMLDELFSYGPDTLQEPLTFGPAKRGVEILAWRAETEAGDLAPEDMFENIQLTLASIDVNLEASLTEDDEYLLWINSERMYKYLHSFAELSKARWLQIYEQRQQKEQASRRGGRPDDYAQTLIDRLER